MMAKADQFKHLIVSKTIDHERDSSSFSAKDMLCARIPAESFHSIYAETDNADIINSS